MAHSWRFEFSYSPAELRESIPESRIPPRPIAAAGIFSLMLGAYQATERIVSGMALAEPSSWIGLAFSSAGAWIALGLGLCAAARTLYRRASRKAAAYEDREIRIVCRLTVEGVTVGEGPKAMRLDWWRLRSWEEKPLCFSLRFSEGSVLLPKRVLGDENARVLRQRCGLMPAVAIPLPSGLSRANIARWAGAVAQGFLAALFATGSAALAYGTVAVGLPSLGLPFDPALPGRIFGAPDTALLASAHVASRPSDDSDASEPEPSPEDTREEMSARAESDADRPSREQRQVAVDKQSVETLQRYLKRFMQELAKGNVETSLETYRQAIAFFRESDLLTGESVLDARLSEKIERIERTLDAEKDPAARADLFARRAAAQYDMADYLYYHPKLAQLRHIAVYYFLLAYESGGEANGVAPGGSAVGLRYQGMAMRDIGLYPQTIRLLEASAALDARDAVTFYELGNAYRESADAGKAAENYERAIAIDPKYDLARLNLAETYKKRGETEKTIETYRALLSTCHDYCNAANYNFAWVFYREKKYPEAIALCDNAIAASAKKSEKYRLAYRLKGVILYDLGQYDAAIEALESSLNDPDEPKVDDNDFSQNTAENESYAYLVDSYIKKRDYRNAQKYLDYALDQLFPGDKELTKLRAKLRDADPPAPVRRAD